MLNVGAGEIALILVVALLVLGPKRLPELARAIGKFMREFRRQTDEVRSTLESEFYRMDQDIQREEPKPAPSVTPGPTPIPHGDAPQDAARILPPITGPLDGGRRVADELNLQPPRSKIGSAPPEPQLANAPPTEVPAAADTPDTPNAMAATTATTATAAPAGDATDEASAAPVSAAPAKEESP